MPVAPDDDLGPLAHDITPEADPRSPGELEAESRRRGQRIGLASPAPARSGAGRRRLEDDQEHAGPPRQRGHPGELVGESGRSSGPGGQVDDEQVDRSGLEERAGHRETLVKVGRREDDEPLEAYSARDRLDRVETPLEVEPGDDRARRLGLGDETEGEGRPARRGAAAQGKARRPRHAAWAEDRIERREPGADDRADRVGGRGPGGGRSRGRGRLGRSPSRRLLALFVRQRDRRERPDRHRPLLTEGPRRGCAPAFPKGREGGADVGGGVVIGCSTVEHLFYFGKPRHHGVIGTCLRWPVRCSPRCPPSPSTGRSLSSTTIRRSGSSSAHTSSGRATRSSVRAMDGRPSRRSPASVRRSWCSTSCSPRSTAEPSSAPCVPTRARRARRS